MEGSQKQKTVIDINTEPLQKKPHTSIGSYFGLPKQPKVSLRKKNGSKNKPQ